MQCICVACIANELTNYSYKMLEYNAEKYITNLTAQHKIYVFNPLKSQLHYTRIFMAVCASIFKI